MERVLGHISRVLEVKVKGQIMYFLINAPPKPFDVAIVNVSPSEPLDVAISNFADA